MEATAFAYASGVGRVGCFFFVRGGLASGEEQDLVGSAAATLRTALRRCYFKDSADSDTAVRHLRRKRNWCTVLTGQLILIELPRTRHIGVVCKPERERAARARCVRERDRERERERERD